MADFINGVVFASVLFLGLGRMVLFYVILRYEKEKLERQKEKYKFFDIVNENNKSRQSSAKDI